MLACKAVALASSGRRLSVPMECQLDAGALHQCLSPALSLALPSQVIFKLVQCAGSGNLKDVSCTQGNCQGVRRVINATINVASLRRHTNASNAHLPSLHF